MQLELPSWDADTLQHRLEHCVNHPLDLSFTDNVSTMMTFKPAGFRKPARLRLHRMFLGAEPDVVDALGDWMLGRRRRSSATMLDAFIAANRHLIDTRRQRRGSRLRTAGSVHDLLPHYRALNALHFEDTIDAPITWGRLPTKKNRRSIRLGSYTPEDHLIRIHPYLDQDFVPEYFLQYIIFHEMLHAHLGHETTPGGRRRVHTKEFYRQESTFPDYDRAIAWHDEPRNLNRLLRPAKKKSA